ncbi:MAG: hypothetical protein U0514_03525 [Candidatus Andersenbacteria bacterium]
MGQNLVASFDLSRPSWDVFIIGFFIIGSLLYGISLGRDRVVTILVSIYMALAVVNYAPFLGTFSGDIGIDKIFVVRISVFLTAFLGLFFLLSRSALMRTIAKGDEQGGIITVIIFSVLQVGLLISLTLSFLPFDISSHLAPLTRQIFVSDYARFVWIAAPIVAMLLFGRSGRGQRRTAAPRDDE